MAKFIIGNENSAGELELFMIINAKSSKEAIKIFKKKYEPSSGFIEYLKYGLEEFYLDYETENEHGSNSVSKKVSIERISKYFNGKPRFKKIYLEFFLNRGGNENFVIENFPPEMIDWIWRKELKTDNWYNLVAIDLSSIKEI